MTLGSRRNRMNLGADTSGKHTPGLLSHLGHLLGKSPTPIHLSAISLCGYGTQQNRAPVHE